MWDFVRTHFTKAYNYVWTSRPWFYTWELKNRLGQAFIVGLMRLNHIEIQDPNNPIWSYVLGDLSDKALKAKDGVAREDLYLINTRIKVFGYELPIKLLRGFSFMSVASDSKTMLNFCNAPARSAFDIPAGLVQLPNFVAFPLEGAATQERKFLKEALWKNQHRLWQSAKHYCQNLDKVWHDDKSVSENLTLLTIRLVAQAGFGIRYVPDETYGMIQEFEDLWQHPEKLTGARFVNNINDFMGVSSKMHLIKQQDEAKRGSGHPVDDLPALENDFVKEFFEFHRDNTSYLSKPQDLNVASFLAIFGNLPKAIIGLAFLVFSNEHYLEEIKAERLRLLEEMDRRKIDPDSQDAFDFLCSHSELFERFYWEVLRYWFIAPVVPRLNLNMLANKIGPWGHDMRINQDHDIPPRSLAVIPQRHIAMDPKEWSNPQMFDPHRSEYQFKTKEDGSVSNIGKKPMVFGGGFRLCPGQNVSRKTMYAIMWWLPQYFQLSLTEKEQAALQKKQPMDTHHMPLEPDVGMVIKGILHQYNQEERDEEDEVNTVNTVNTVPVIPQGSPMQKKAAFRGE